MRIGAPRVGWRWRAISVGVGWSLGGAVLASCGGRSAQTSPESGVVVSADAGKDVESAACVSGKRCNPDDDLCQTGITSCSSGTTQCTHRTDVADGTACGENEVCKGGECVACASGILCNPDG